VVELANLDWNSRFLTFESELERVRPSRPHQVRLAVRSFLLDAVSGAGEHLAAYAGLSKVPPTHTQARSTPHGTRTPHKAWWSWM